MTSRNICLSLGNGKVRLSHLGNRGGDAGGATQGCGGNLTCVWGDVVLDDTPAACLGEALGGIVLADGDTGVVGGVEEGELGVVARVEPLAV